MAKGCATVLMHANVRAVTQGSYGPGVPGHSYAPGRLRAEAHTGAYTSTIIAGPWIRNTDPRGASMQCTTINEANLIRMIDANRYGDPDTLCSTACRQSLAWSDWETDTSKAMYEVLRNMENVLRCAISARLVLHYGQEDWWEAPKLHLTYDTKKKLAEAKAKLRRAHVPLSPIAIQREVTLGFWVSLMGRGADYETQLWRPMHAAFPHYKGRRVELHHRVDHLRILRNKVAHQERIGGRNLAADRRSALKVIGYVSETIAQRVSAADVAIPALLATRPGVCPQRRGENS